MPETQADIEARVRTSTEDHSLDGEITLGVLAAMVWRHRAVFFCVFLVPVVFGFLYLHVATYKYRADLALAPPQSSSGVGAQGQLGNLGGLAALAGVNIGGSGGNINFQLYREAIFERQTADVLARDPRIMRTIFAKEWNDDTQSWAPPVGVIAGAKRLVNSVIGVPAKDWAPPNAARLQEVIRKTVTVAVNTKSPVVRVSFDHPDPAFAVYFLNAMHEVVDSSLRARLVARTETYIAYLSEKLMTVTIAEHRQALAQALSDQEKLRMTASSGVAFAAEPFGEAAATRKPVSPNGPLVLIVASLLGIAAGIGASLAYGFFRASRS